MADQSSLRLMNELKGLQKKLPEGFSAAPTDECDLFKWDIMIIGPPDTPYEGGLFEATMKFPRDYPLNPPELRFRTYVHHPNVYPDGKVCISILHPPGEDIYGYEEASERWLPIYTVETIIVNVVCMLSSPNDESPANVDVAKQWRENYPLSERRGRKGGRRRERRRGG
ncbi:MAG: ubiquitin-conjugating enzyme/RWD-like protein [Benniella sp.]|nr:MAG: ubiquitin-conjugating enzyme/RWD-like protein [Benniella sp.]